jgi:hypothetical protein
MVDDIRKDITEKLILLNILPENSSPNRVRLREKCSNLAGNVLKNGTTLSQNGIYSVYDGKTFCIQILDDEEDLSLKFKSEKSSLSGDNADVKKTDFHGNSQNEKFINETSNENILRLYAEKCEKMRSGGIVNNNNENNVNDDGNNNSNNNDNNNNDSDDGKVVHRIPDSDTLPRKVPTTLLQVQLWCRRTFSMENKIEIFVRQDETVKSLSKRLASYYKIPHSYLRILFAPVNHEIYICELPSSSPTKYSSRIWFDGSVDSRKLSELCDVRLDDGDVLILQNIREPLRELTEMENISVKKKSQGCNYYAYPTSTSTFTTTSSTTASCAIAEYDPQHIKSSPSYSNFESSTYTTAVQYGVKNKKKENGIRIKTHKDRMKESNKEDETTKDTKEIKEKPFKILTLTHDPQNVLSHKTEHSSNEEKLSNETIILSNENSSCVSLTDIDDEKNQNKNSTNKNINGQNNTGKKSHVEVEVEGDENVLESSQEPEPFLGTDDEAKKMGFDLFLD